MSSSIKNHHTCSMKSSSFIFLFNLLAILVLSQDSLRNLNLTNLDGNSRLLSDKKESITVKNKTKPNASDDDDERKDISILKYLTYARHNKRLYCSPKRVVKFIENLDLTGRVHKTFNNLIFSLRAPEIRYLSTWSKERENILVPYLEVKDARVDKKFYQDFQIVSQEIQSYLLKIMKTGNQRYFILTGHRLAGVYAIFTALMMKNIPSSIKTFNVFTWGSPRFGNAAFANHVNSVLNVRRVTLMDDQITRFPIYTSTSDLTSYLHPGEEIWIKKKCDCDNFEYFNCPGVKEKDELKESPFCNNSQPEHDPDFTYDGPYFGFIFGHQYQICEEV
ncbi:hypothetical protein G9A89_004838 [Geosiphon pyriformis]|nr:hypothetical protein G9A89_004838 [Geosiphon pyriformis]